MGGRKPNNQHICLFFFMRPTIDQLNDLMTVKLVFQNDKNWIQIFHGVDNLNAKISSRKQRAIFKPMPYHPLLFLLHLISRLDLV